MKRTGAFLFGMVLIWMSVGCGGGGSSPAAPQQPLIISISPTLAQLETSAQTSNTAQFTASVQNAANTAVTWQVNGVAGGNSTVGTISPSGLYTAPAALPSPPTATITAVAAADPSKTASATVTLTAAIVVAVSPNLVNMETSGGSAPNTLQFTATVQNTADTRVTWQVNKIAGGSSTYGTISTSGLYSAPLMVPNEPIVVTAVSTANSSKSASVPVNLSWYVGIHLSLADGGTTTVTANTLQTIAANVDTYSNTKDVLWTVNGTPMGSSAVGIVFPRMNWPNTIYYNAPATVSAPTPIVLTATAKINPAKSDSMTLTIVPGDSSQVLTLTPAASSMHVAEQQQFTALLNGSPVTTNSWMAAGQYSSMTTGRITTTGTYTAPYEVPDTGTVVISTSYGDFPPKTATAMVTIAPPAVDPNTRVNGTYALAMSDGIHQSQLVAVLNADGQGHFTGTADINTVQGFVKDYTFTGTYKIGADGRGTATIPIPVVGSTTTQDQIFYFMLASDTEAFIVEKNGYLYGSLYKQAGGPFSASTVSGPYAFRMDGIAFESSSLGRQNVPTAIAGLIAGDAAGKLTGHGDVSQKGALSAATLTGTYSVAANGRGTLTLPFGLQTVHYSAVLVSSDKLLLASMDDITSLTGQVPPFLSGIAEKQGAATFSSSSLSGPYVYYALGYSYTGAGRFEADGISNIANGLADYRTVESPTSIWMKSWLDVPFTCTFTVAADGRITASFTGTNAPKGLVGYMIAPDRFFILLDGDAAAPSGSAFAQSDLPFDDTKLDGRYAVQFILPPVLATGWMTREATAQPYPLVYSWMDEYTAKTEWQWSFYSPDALGRASFLPVGAGWSFGSTMRYYAISGSRMLIMSTADIPGQGNQLGWMEKID